MHATYTGILSDAGPQQMREWNKIASHRWYHTRCIGFMSNVGTQWSTVSEPYDMHDLWGPMSCVSLMDAHWSLSLQVIGILQAGSATLYYIPLWHLRNSICQSTNLECLYSITICAPSGCAIKHANATRWCIAWLTRDFIKTHMGASPRVPLRKYTLMSNDSSGMYGASLSKSQTAYMTQTLISNNHLSLSSYDKLKAIIFQCLQCMMHAQACTHVTCKSLTHWALVCKSSCATSC